MLFFLPHYSNTNYDIKSHVFWLQIMRYFFKQRAAKNTFVVMLILKFFFVNFFADNHVIYMKYSFLLIP